MADKTINAALVELVDNLLEQMEGRSNRDKAALIVAVIEEAKTRYAKYVEPLPEVEYFTVIPTPTKPIPEEAPTPVGQEEEE